MIPLIAITVGAAIICAVYFAMLRLLRRPMGEIGYAIGFVSTFLILASWWFVIMRELVHIFGVWAYIGFLFFVIPIAFIVDRRSLANGRLPEPQGRFGRWYQAALRWPIAPKPAHFEPGQEADQQEQPTLELERRGPDLYG